MDFQTDGGTVGGVSCNVFKYAVVIDDKSMSLCRTLIGHQLLLCFAFLKKPRIQTFQQFPAYLWVMLRPS